MTNTKENKAMTLRIGKRMKNYCNYEMNIFVKILFFLPILLIMTSYTCYEEIVYFFKDCNLLQKAIKLLGLLSFVFCLYIIISFIDCFVALFQAPIGESWGDYIMNINFVNLLISLF